MLLKPGCCCNEFRKAEMCSLESSLHSSSLLIKNKYPFLGPVLSFFFFFFVSPNHMYFIKWSTSNHSCMHWCEEDSISSLHCRCPSYFSNHIACLKFVTINHVLPTSTRLSEWLTLRIYSVEIEHYIAHIPQIYLRKKPHCIIFFLSNDW